MARDDGIRIGEAWLRGNELIVATPYGYELTEHHNCDQMGCGAWHIIARVPATEEMWKSVDFKREKAKAPR